jgi:hypothetical protein
MSDDRLTPLQAKRKLNQLLLRLGLPFAECARLIRYDPEADTAYWSYNRTTGEEAIGVGPQLVQLPVPQLEMVLRHEILHRSVYNRLHERLADPELANLVLDICINRMLAEAYPEPMRKMSEAVYADVPMDSLIQLANVAAPRAELRGQVGTLYSEIWDLPGRAAQSTSPARLYYRLLRLGRVVIVGSPWGRPEETGAALPWPDDAMRSAASAVWADLNEHLPVDAGMGRELADYAVVPAALETSRLTSFVRRLRVRRVAIAVRQAVMAELEAEVVWRPYPLLPSRAGLVWQLTGLAELTGRYRNRETRLEGRRLALGLYFDVSGSMVAKFPVVAAIARELGELPLKVRAFDTAVREVDIDRLSDGHVQGGGGTDFDAPVSDFLQDEELFGALVITDGYGEVRSDVAARHRRDRRPLSVIFLLDDRERLRAGSLGDLAAEHMVFRIPSAQRARGEMHVP